MKGGLFSLTAPQFWWQSRPTLFACFLSPLGQLYGLITARRMAKKGKTLDVPIICVGNFTIGGAGKTPVALALGALFQEQGFTIAFISRGYGAKAILRQPLRVDANRHAAYDVGDEALLLARLAPTYVCRNRVFAARQAVEDGAKLIIMDDGLQNPALTKTLSLAVVPAQNAFGQNVFGNGLCFPAGPLRAPVEKQLPFVDGVVVLSQSGADALEDLDYRLAVSNVPKFHATIMLDAPTLARLKDHRILAFAGIGKPEKFYASLEAQDIKVEHTQNFPDHYDYTRQDYAALLATAKEKGLHLVTTEKDFVKIKAFDAAHAVIPVPMSVRFEDPESVLALLHARVAASTKS